MTSLTVTGHVSLTDAHAGRVDLGRVGSGRVGSNIL